MFEFLILRICLVDFFFFFFFLKIFPSFLLFSLLSGCFCEFCCFFFEFVFNRQNDSRSWKEAMIHLQCWGEGKLHLIVGV